MTASLSHADLAARLSALARLARTESPVVSVYLNTRWTDEQQRERTRVFLRNEIRKARAGAPPELEADLAWVEKRGESLIEQMQFPDARAVALFACRSAGLREILPLRVPVDDFFVVGDTPHLRRLAALLEATPATLIAFVDGESARLVRLLADGVGEVVDLENEVQGRHRQGGWQLLAQSRYQRHIQAQRGRHFDAVAAALTELVDEHGVARIVLAGTARAVAVFRSHLEKRVSAMVDGAVGGARHEPVSVLAERAVELLGRRDGETEAAEVEAAVTEAAKGGRATAGLEATLEAATRGAVRRLYLLRTFHESGRRCGACGAIQPGAGAACRVCGGAAQPIELGEALVERVVATGGSVEMIEAQPWLAGVQGVAALLRYPL
jgi:peptide subunit release factor 1 (eRF1)